MHCFAVAGRRFGRECGLAHAGMSLQANQPVVSGVGGPGTLSSYDDLQIGMLCKRVGILLRYYFLERSYHTGGRFIDL